VASDITQTAVRSAWSHLDPAKIRGGELVARRPPRDSPGEVLCAINRAGTRYFLIPIGPEEEDLVDDSIRGLSVATERLEISGEQSRRYVSVLCGDQGAYDLFDVVGAELVTAVGNMPKSPREATRLVINRWKRFWSAAPRSVLDDGEIAGLFGELWFIHVWLGPSIGVPVAIKAWRGPFGSRHDFESKSMSVEVKTTTARDHRTHLINGIDQLASPESGPLLFFSLAILPERGATNSLVVLIDAIRSLLQTDAEVANVFDTALSRAGYSDAFRAHYADKTFRVVNGLLFEVDGAFPRHTNAQLLSAYLMPGVSAVEYCVTLDGLQASAIADSPDKAGAVLQTFAV
jgi:hypothetical protein